MHPVYEYIWVWEDDLAYTGNIRNFFDLFTNRTGDGNFLSLFARFLFSFEMTFSRFIFVYEIGTIESA